MMAFVFTLAQSLVRVEQFGMAQCPMTSLLTTEFFNRCLRDGRGIKSHVNYTLNMVGGTSGGLIDNTSDTKSFHGSQEITAEKYFLCAREHEGPNQGIGTYNWVNFTACMNGYAGIGICTYYLPHEMEGHAQTCAEAHGIDWHTLDTCANSPEGDRLFRASEYYTDGEMRRFISANHTGDGIPQYGTAGGVAWGIPIIRIAGVVYKDTPDAYVLLGKRICEAAGLGPLECGCEAL
jgi:hypothetical protein